jgi:hypothetical protein
MASDYALPLNALTLFSNRKTVLATLTDMLKVENERSKIPEVSEFMGIFVLQNPGVFPDERSALSVRKRSVIGFTCSQRSINLFSRWDEQWKVCGYEPFTGLEQLCHLVKLTGLRKGTATSCAATINS